MNSKLTSPINKDDLLVIINEVLRYLNKHGWEAYSEHEICKQQGWPLELYLQAIPNRNAIMKQTFKAMQYYAENNVKFHPDDSTKDKMFALYMARFEYLLPYRPCLLELKQELKKKPFLAVTHASLIIDDMMISLKMADVDISGVDGVFKANIAVFTMRNCFSIFFEEEDDDLNRTMAYLHKILLHLEKLSSWYK